MIPIDSSKQEAPSIIVLVFNASAGQLQAPKALLMVQTSTLSREGNSSLNPKTLAKHL